MRYLILILLLSACQSSDTIDGSSQELFEASLHRILDDLEMTEQLYLTYCMTALPYINDKDILEFYDGMTLDELRVKCKDYYSERNRLEKARIEE